MREVIEQGDYEKYKATWKYEQWFWLEKQFARHKHFRPYGCVYLLELENRLFPPVLAALIQQSKSN